MFMPLRSDIGLTFVDPTQTGTDFSEVSISRDAVEGINSQLLYEADRFVFSGADNFALARRLLDQNPGWKDPASRRIRLRADS
jgi:hypothetical protein